MSDSSAIPQADAVLPSPAGHHVLVDKARTLLHTWLELAAAHVRVIVLDVRRATLGVVTMMGMAVAVGLLAVSSWLLLVGMTILWAVNTGVRWELAISLAAGSNLVLAVLLCLAIRQISTHLLPDRARERMAGLPAE